MSLNREGNPYSIIFHAIHNPGLLVWNLLTGRKVSFCPKLGSCWVLLKTSTYQRSLDANSMEYKNPDKTLQLCSEMKKQRQYGLKSTAPDCFVHQLLVDRCLSALAHRRPSPTLPSLALDLIPRGSGLALDFPQFF